MEEIWQDRQERSFLIFLFLFCALLLSFGILSSLVQARELKEALLYREAQLVSGMLASGLSEGKTAEILSVSEVSEEGKGLLLSTGRTEESPALLYPAVRRAAGRTALVSAAEACLMGTVLLAGTLLFLWRREALYEQAAGVLSRFAEGDFSRHLPRGGTGALYRLFSAADQLSRAAQVRGEAERAAKEALKNAVSDISHQMKTPVAALSMYMEILQEEPEREETVREFSAKALQSLERMRRLIGLLLKIMCLDAGSVRFEPEDCPVSELVREAVEELTTRAKQEGKRLIAEGDPKERVRCDPAWTAEALSNLVKNALDHTEREGTVRISWERSPGLFRLSVEDDGCGILPEDLPHIFKRFYRSGRDRAARSMQGVGLGLPLAKAVVEGQGGVLSVSSTPDEENFSDERRSPGEGNFSDERRSPGKGNSFDEGGSFSGRTVFSISFLSEL